MDNTMLMHNPRLEAMAKYVHDPKHAFNRVKGIKARVRVRLGSGSGVQG